MIEKTHPKVDYNLKVIPFILTSDKLLFITLYENGTGKKIVGHFKLKL